MRLSLAPVSSRLRGWLLARPPGLRRVKARLLEGMRDVGVLLIAFAPLDAAVANDRQIARSLLLFLALGCFLYLGALAIEWRREGDD